MKTVPTRPACEQQLIDKASECLAQGLTDPEALHDAQDDDGLMQAMLVWAGQYALRCASLCCYPRQLFPESSTAASAEEAALDWIVHFWDRGENPDNPYPRLHAMCDYIGSHGAQRLPGYLMTALKRRLIDLYNDRYPRLPTGPHGEDGSGGDAACVRVTFTSCEPLVKLSSSCDIPGSRLLRQERLEHFISHLGEDLLQDIPFLVRGLEKNRIPVFGDEITARDRATMHRIAEMIFNGKTAALCRAIASRCSQVFCTGNSHAWDRFLQAADAFVLPAHLTDIKALESHMFRKTGARGRARFLDRTGGLPY